MHIHHDLPDFRYVLRGVTAAGVAVNERVLGRSFIITPQQLLEDWPVRESVALEVADLAALLALQPALIVLGTGSRLRFPAQAVSAAALTRGIGIEAMDNAAAARTFNLLASEGRKVVAGFVLG